MNETIAAKRDFTYPYCSLLFAVAVIFLLPRYGSWAVMAGCASVLSLYVVILPKHCRSRSGSMLTATCLVVGMWVATAAITAMTLAGAISS